jgi:hypothetical protein
MYEHSHVYVARIKTEQNGNIFNFTDEFVYVKFIATLRPGANWSHDIFMNMQYDEDYSWTIIRYLLLI